MVKQQEQERVFCSKVNDLLTIRIKSTLPEEVFLEAISTLLIPNKSKKGVIIAEILICIDNKYRSIQISCPIEFLAEKVFEYLRASDSIIISYRKINPNSKYERILFEKY